ncbi:tryptophan synthase subunit alpha [Spongorhabdus nitratireducens]
MSRIQTCFDALQAQGRKALIPYFTAGDPDKANTVAMMHGMVEQGADIIELGIPFSDPTADGVVIQQAHLRALKNGANLSWVLETVKTFRETNSTTPVVLMGYLNPIEIMGYETFVETAADAGVDGVLCVDLPPEAAGRFRSQLVEKDIDLIFLIAPTTTDERIGKICSQASGYIYYVSLKGVTGSATLNTEEVSQRVQHIRNYTDLPVAVGFGISDGPSARAISSTSDGAIVGSVLVKEIAAAAQAGQPESAVGRVGEKLAAMRTAMDNG